MSFLIDGPWLYANGRLLAGRKYAKPLGAATVAAFYSVSIPLYKNSPKTHRIARACGAESGRDWMLNSGVLKLHHRNPGTRTHAAAAALFATYPLFMWLGLRHGSRRS